jgi:hypothetical protein
MRTESVSRTQRTVLVVADDFRVLALARAVLMGKGHRVLLASDVRSALRLLRQKCGFVHSVAIRAGMVGYEQLRKRSLRLGAAPWTFCCAVDDRSVRLEGPDSGADWESAALETH